MLIAKRRWEGVVVVVVDERSRGVVAMRRYMGLFVVVDGDGEWVKSEVGCAIRMTPRKDMQPEIFSTVVKGSCRIFEQA